MSSQASRISKRYFRISSGSIEYDLRLFKGLAEERVGDGTRFHQINRTAKQPLKILDQPEVLLCVFCRGHIRKLHQQVEIAVLGLEPAICSRAEYRKFFDLSDSAYPDNFIQVFFDYTV